MKNLSGIYKVGKLNKQTNEKLIWYIQSGETEASCTRLGKVIPGGKTRRQSQDAKRNNS
jgi:hypothetical protein